MEAIKQKPLDGATVAYKEGYGFLVNHPDFTSAINHVKSLKPVSVPLHVKRGSQMYRFSLRRTRRDHFAYLNQAEERGVSFERAVANVVDSETKRFYLATLIPDGISLQEFLKGTGTIQSKFNMLKKVALELAKLNKAGLRHGDLLSSHVYVKGDQIVLTNPEVDTEIVAHLHSDFDQLRETLLHLERELHYEPPQLWERVRKENYFKNVKA